MYFPALIPTEIGDRVEAKFAYATVLKNRRGLYIDMKYLFMSPLCYYIILSRISHTFNRYIHSTVTTFNHFKESAVRFARSIG